MPKAIEPIHLTWGTTIYSISCTDHRGQANDDSMHMQFVTQRWIPYMADSAARQFSSRFHVRSTDGFALSLSGVVYTGTTPVCHPGTPLDLPPWLFVAPCACPRAGLHVSSRRCRRS